MNINKNIISNVEHYTLYGIRITHYKNENIHRAYIGGKKYETKTRSDMIYTIQNIQAGIGVIH